MEDVDSVLFVQRRYHPNQYPIVEALQERKHTVRFLSLKRGYSEDYSTLRPDFLAYSRFFLLLYFLCRPIFGDDIRYRYGVPRPLWYYRYLREVNPDVIIVKKYFAITFVTILYAKVLNVDLVFYDQAPVYGDESDYRKRKLATAVYYVFHREHLVRYSPVLGNPNEDEAIPRSYYIPFVAPTPLSPPDREYFNGGCINVMMVGKLHQERKNHLLLLRVVDKLREEFEFTVTLVGALRDRRDPHFQTIRSFIDDRGMETNVDIRENITYRAVREAYTNHDVFVLPSEDEPAAVSHLEAMSEGLAIVCSETNGTSCYVADGKNGFLFDCQSPTDLEAKLETLCESRDRIRQFGQHSREVATTEYSPEAFYERLSHIIEEHYR